MSGVKFFYPLLFMSLVISFLKNAFLHILTTKEILTKLAIGNNIQCKRQSNHKQILHNQDKKYFRIGCLVHSMFL